MHARVVLGVGKGVLFREFKSVLIYRGVPLYHRGSFVEVSNRSECASDIESFLIA